MATDAAIHRLAKTADHSLGACPACRAGVVVPTRYGYCCSRRREGCRFSVWGQIAGRPIGSKIVRALLGAGRTDTLTGFRGRSGSVFSAVLTLDPRTHSVRLAHAPREQQP